MNPRDPQRRSPRVAAGPSFPVPLRGAVGAAAAISLLLIVGGCSREVRSLSSDQPQTPPANAADPRAPRYEKNAYQISQGSRYFTWYGCTGCHGAGAEGVLNLANGQRRHGNDFDQVYGFIAHGHAGPLASYGDRVPVEQLWQMTAYVRSLPDTKPEVRRRQDLDQNAEPQASQWSGPMR